VFDRLGVRDQLVESTAVVQSAEEVEGAPRSREPDLPSAQERARLQWHRPARRISNAHIEFVEQGLQLADVLLVDLVNDVHLLRRDRGSVQHGSRASDHDELDVGRTQRVEVSVLRVVRHGGIVPACGRFASLPAVAGAA
jgi:hypothetical protein